MARVKGRLMTTRKDIVDAMESTPARATLVRKRALLDARLGQLCAGLGLVNQRKVGERTFAPKTGGRVRGRGAGCKRQQFRTDFETLTNKGKLDAGNPGYFMMVSGKYSFPLWICETSHAHYAVTKSDFQGLSKGVYVRTFTVPPMSIFIGRGDVFHAGASSEDGTLPDHVLFRYHTCMVPEKYKLPDAVELTPYFTSRFIDGTQLKNVTKSKVKDLDDEGNVLMDDLEGDQDDSNNTKQQPDPVVEIEQELAAISKE